MILTVPLFPTSYEIFPQEFLLWLLYMVLYAIHFEQGCYLRILDNCVLANVDLLFKSTKRIDNGVSSFTLLSTTVNF